MPVKNPRINVVLEKPLYRTIEQLASRDGVSLSLKVRDLVKEALEIEEDFPPSMAEGAVLNRDEEAGAAAMAALLANDLLTIPFGRTLCWLVWKKLL